MVKPSLSSWKIEVALVAPVFGIVMKGLLKDKENKSSYNNKIQKILIRPSTFFVIIFELWIVSKYI